MKYSIVVPVFNNQAGINKIHNWFIRCCSVREDVELIIIDDGSPSRVKIDTDNSQILIYRLDKNRGVDAARNKGIEVSSGHWIVFLDSDDLLITGILDYYDSLISQNKSNLVFTFGSINCNIMRKSVSLHQHKLIANRKTLILKNYCILSGSLVHSSIFKKVRFKSIVHEDLDFWLRISEQHQIYVLPKLCVLRSTGNKSSLSGKKMQSIRWHFRVIRNYTNFVLMPYVFIMYGYKQATNLIVSKMKRIIL